MRKPSRRETDVSKGQKHPGISIRVAEGRRNGVLFILVAIPKKPVCPIFGEQVICLGDVGMQNREDDGIVGGA